MYPESTSIAFSLLGLGFILGLRHSLDADHLAAVATIVTEKKTVRSSSLVGLLWGIGHTFSLLGAGVLVLALDISVSPEVGRGLESVVALVLIGMGIRVLVKLRRGQHLHAHVHQHGNYLHAHPHLHKHPHASEQAKHDHGAGVDSAQRRGFLPILVGFVHGLAGSAGLMLLITTTIRDDLTGFFYILAFGTGSIGGMLAMSTVLGIPFLLTMNRFGSLHRFVLAGTGLFSIGFGIYLGWETVVAVAFL